MPSVAGPRRPQDRVDLRGVKQNRSARRWSDVFKKEVGESVTPRLDRWSAEAPVSPLADSDQATTGMQKMRTPPPSICTMT